MCDSTHAPQLQSWRQELLPSAPPAAPNCKEAFKRTTSGAKWQNSAFVVTCQALNVVLGVLGAGSAVDRERVGCASAFVFLAAFVCVLFTVGRSGWILNKEFIGKGESLWLQRPR